MTAACRVVLCCAALTAVPPTFANEPRSLRFRHVTPDDGLSQSFVYAIEQDATGFLWFGTQEGLNRYDGEDMLVFAPDGTPGAIPDETIRDLLLTRDGTLWVATDAGGLSRYDAASETFEVFRHQPSRPGSLPDDRVRVLFEDSRGQLWVGTDGSGLARSGDEPGQFLPVPTAADSWDGGLQVWSIAEDADGTLWLGTAGGLVSLDRTSLQSTLLTHTAEDTGTLSSSEVRAVMVGRDGALWVGTADGLNRRAPGAVGFTRFLHEAGDSSSLPENRVNTVFEDAEGIVWVGTAAGLSAFDAEGSTFSNYRSDLADRYSLPHDNVVAIEQDRDGALWVGTYAGVSRWDPATRAMALYRHDPGNPASLAANTITSFSEDAAGRVYVGTFGGGISILDRETNEFTQLGHDPADPQSLPSNRVMALLHDRNHTLWVGTRASGLYRYNDTAGSFDAFRHDPDDPASIGADGITYLLESSAGELWVATFGGGLNRLDPESAAFERFRHDATDTGSLSSDRVLVLCEDANGDIWAGTYGGGLNRIDPATGEATRFRHDPANTDGLAGDEIYMIEEDASGNLWVGIKGAGIQRWRHEDREAGRVRFERFSVLNGMPSATVYAGEWDDDGGLWLSTARGLSRLDLTALNFRNYGIRYGLQGEEFNLAASLRTADGELYFGGLKGFNSFRPGILNGPPAPPKVVITGLESFGGPLSLETFRRSGTPVRLRHDQDSITFRFAAIDFDNASRQRFQYRLEGVDSDWVNSGSHHDVTYSHVHAGTRRFEVRVGTGDGGWSEPAIILLDVRPAPWNTLFARMTYVVGALLLLAALFRRHTRRVQELALVRHAQEINVMRERLETAQETANVGNWDWDRESGVVGWSDQMYRLLGIDKRSVKPGLEVLLDHVHPDDRPRVSAAIGDATQTGKPFTIDHRVVRSDGRVCVVNHRARVSMDNRGRPQRMTCTLLDITQRKAAEQQVESRAEFQSLLAKLSTTLAQGRPEDLNGHVTSALTQIGQRYPIDTAAVSWLADDGRRLVTRYSWPEKTWFNGGNGVALNDIAWSTQQLQSGETLVIDDVDALPESAEDDQLYYRKYGVRAVMMFPVFNDAGFEGVCYFDRRKPGRLWTEVERSELRLLAETLGAALARQRANVAVLRLKEELQQENVVLREEVRLAHGFDEIVGEDPAMLNCLAAVEKVAPTDVPVLILGETGTGKELIARAVHKLSNRADRPIVSVNCPALPANLIESELFGHEKGAFTGAESSRRGRFELADGGTLFLDEIGELPMDLQAKLLRVLQTGEFERLGGMETLKVNVRLVAATNRNLRESINRSEFRSDLYFRIGSYPLTLPPLRERKGDIARLAEHFVHKHAEPLGKDIKAIAPRFLRKLRAYDWPGNIRELESTIERALISSTGGDVLDLDEPFPVRQKGRQIVLDLPPDGGKDLASVESAYIAAILRETHWRISGPNNAADILGMRPSTLRSRIKKLGIEKPD